MASSKTLISFKKLVYSDFKKLQIPDLTRRYRITYFDLFKLFTVAVVYINTIMETKESYQIIASLCLLVNLWFCKGLLTIKPWF